MADYGLATMGITFGYGTETTAGTKPTAFTKLTRIQDIPAISLTPAQVSVTCLEDVLERFVAGRMATGGQINIVVNATEDTVDEWDDLLTAYAALTGGKQMWFETIVPGFTKAFFFVAQPPKALPTPDVSGDVVTMSIPLTIVDVKGLDTKIAFT